MVTTDGWSTVSTATGRPRPEIIQTHAVGKVRQQCHGDRGSGEDPAGIKGLPDLARPGVKVAFCQSAVPCGTAAAKVLNNARLTLTPVTQEADVKAVMTKVALGEVDAGVVYVTDVRAAGEKVKGIRIPTAVNASTKYPIATLTTAPNKAGGKAFTDYVLSADGAAVLTAAGFAMP
jgi:molybdate transport system substrate-binding protein